MNSGFLFNNEKLKKYFIPFVFILYLVIGLFIYDDYGVSTDESTHRKISTGYLIRSIEQIANLVNADSIVAKINKEKEKEPDFFQKYVSGSALNGEAFNVPLLIIEAAFCGIKTKATKEVYEVRHLFTFLFYYIGTIFLFFIMKDISCRRSVALIATLSFIISPRFFGESFYNPQDTVFLTSCIIAMFFYLRFIKMKTIKNAILLGFFAAFATGTRFLGIQFLMLALFFVFLGFIKDRKINKSDLMSSLILIMVYTIFVILMYPSAWSSPIAFSSKLVQNVSSFPKSTIQLFMGNWIVCNDLPWYYVPGWMLVTIPVLYIALFFHGLYLSGRRILNLEKLREFSYDYQVMLSVLMMFFVPLFGVIIKGSVMYNGWRHMYFLYLPFIFIASYSIKYLLEKMEEKGKPVVLYSFFGLYFLSLIVWMVINHPYQYVFFNAVPHSIESRYEKDYWAVSMRDGLTFILETDPAEKITIRRSRGSLRQAVYMLPKEMKKRIVIMPDDSPAPDAYNYYINVGDGYGKRNFVQENNLSEVFSINVYNSIYTQKFKILGVYKK